MAIRRMTALAALSMLCALAQGRFTLEQVLSAPFPSDLTASPRGDQVAWIYNERGARNIWIAQAPGWAGRRLTEYREDDGQDAGEIQWTPDGRSVVYVRGGDLDTLRPSNPNPASNPAGVEQAVWIVSAGGGAPRKVGEGRDPSVSPKGDRIVFGRNGQVWSAALDGSGKPEQLFHAAGAETDFRWAPDGSRLAFRSARTSHAFIGLYDLSAKKLTYIDPSTDSDSTPVWSPDGRRMAFIRIPASSRAFEFGPVREAQPWSIHVYDTASGAAREIWRAASGRGSAFHGLAGKDQIFWAEGDRIVFPWERSGWQLLYSVPAGGGTATLLTPGEFEVESATLQPDRKQLLITSNQGDIERRHVWRVAVERPEVNAITRGEGVEWSPVPVGDGVAMLHSDARKPARPAILMNGPIRDIAPDAIPPDFPESALVVPELVTFTSADGMQIHGQLFRPSGTGRHPAAIFFHGGSRRQMLPAWHYRPYYHNAYAMNQYLASLGYLVLSVNYRSGIGYGMEFREAVNYGATGASEYNDVLGAGLYLRNRPDVDPHRIGLWGGSYGGYLTALGLARASDLFAAGVDFHGVHNWNTEIPNFVSAYDPLKNTESARIAFESSPLAAVDTWKSPVLLIHGDDDRNVPFTETVRLVEALRKRGVPFEQLIFPDEVHDFLTHRRWLEAYTASARFLDRYLK